MAPTAKTARNLLLGGGILAAGAAALLKREKLAQLLPGRGGGGDSGATQGPPQPSNYDAPGPVANTATPIPAPDPLGEPPAHVDPAEEEAAAAAEAAAIGGSAPKYAGDELGEPADEAFRPLAEAGGGEAEGLEQAEADLADNATYRDAGMSDAERQIDDAIEAAGQPFAGETPEPLPPTAEGPIDRAPGDADPAEASSPSVEVPVDETAPGVPGGGISGRPLAGLEDAPGTPGAPATGTPATEPSEGTEAPAAETPGTPPTGERSEAEPDQGDDGGEYRTWSGRAVEP